MLSDLIGELDLYADQDTDLIEALYANSTKEEMREIVQVLAEVRQLPFSMDAKVAVICLLASGLPRFWVTGASTKTSV